METFSVLDSHSKKISNPLMFMVFPWGNAKSPDNGQDIEYWLKIVRIRCKFNVFLTSCVTAWLRVLQRGPVIFSTSTAWHAAVCLQSEVKIRAAPAWYPHLKLEQSFACAQLILQETNIHIQHSAACSILALSSCAFEPSLWSGNHLLVVL